MSCWLVESLWFINLRHRLFQVPSWLSLDQIKFEADGRF
jgi:hypothetical protein